MRTRSLLCGSWTPQLLSCCCCFCCSQLAAPKRQRRWPSGAWLWWVWVPQFQCCERAHRPQVTTRERERLSAHTKERERVACMGSLTTCFCIGIWCGAFLFTHTHTRLCWILFVDASADRQQQLLLSDYTHTHTHTHARTRCARLRWFMLFDAVAVVALCLLPLLFSSLYAVVVVVVVVPKTIYFANTSSTAAAAQPLPLSLLSAFCFVLFVVAVCQAHFNFICLLFFCCHCCCRLRSQRSQWRK